jgi:hypothetical protein
MRNARNLVAEATSFLRQNGFTAGGRERGSVTREQYLFERAMRSQPTGGMPRMGRVKKR